MGRFLEAHGAVEWPRKTDSEWARTLGDPRGAIRLCYMDAGYVGPGPGPGPGRGRTCFDEGGACGAERAGGWAGCPLGVPDLWHGGTLLHTRRSSDWEAHRGQYPLAALRLAKLVTRGVKAWCKALV